MAQARLNGKTLNRPSGLVLQTSKKEYLLPDVERLQSLTDPNTGAAWTLAAVNAAEFGIKITN